MHCGSIFDEMLKLMMFRNCKLVILRIMTLVFFAFDSSMYLDAQVNDDRPSEPGKCYAKLVIPNIYEIQNILYVEYIGNEKYEDVEVEWMEIILQPSAKVWVEKYEDDCPKACKHVFPIWCLVEIPEKVISVLTLKDTSQSDNFIVMEEEVKTIIEPGGFKEWKEVICHSDMTPDLYRRISTALNELGYEIEPKLPAMNAKFKKALTEFQKHTELPIGGFDVETMDALGVKF